MESPKNTAKGKQKGTPPPVQAQQDFLFVDASKSAKGSRQGRRNARSFVMQRARRERPWSTSKHAVKQRKSAETPSPLPVGTPDLSSTSLTPTPSPPAVPSSTGCFPFDDPNHYAVVKHDLCSDCQIFLCRPGQIFCPRCLMLQSSAPSEVVDNHLFDPFGTVSVEMDGFVSELLGHCKCIVPHEQHELYQAVPNPGYRSSSPVSYGAAVPLSPATRSLFRMHEVRGLKLTHFLSRF